MNRKTQMLLIPGPITLPERVLKAMAKPIVNHRGDEFHALYERIEEGLRNVFKTENNVYIISGSGTAGVDMVFQNFVYKGEKVLIPDFGEFTERVVENALKVGAEPVAVKSEWGSLPSLRSIAEAVENNNVGSIFIVHNETSTGVTFRMMEEVANIARKEGILVFADTVSDLGVEPFYTDKLGVDVCVAASQKGLGGPPGLSFVSVSGKALDKGLNNPRRRSFYLDFEKIHRFHLRRETPFTPAIPLLYGMAEALEILKEEGYEERIRRHSENARMIYEFLESENIEIFPRNREYWSTAVIVFKNRGLNADIIIRRLYEEYGILVARGMGRLRNETTRIGNVGYEGRAEIEYFLDSFRKVLKDAGRQP
ncbi:MAG: alanine--glyoxylate aminotransferase family protein [Candidatus Brockarchaeota archaeon]|nr:alanine--glyoxylate aminotransferase family protein [Candidatus Brockarchaeota archaeon]